MEAPQHNIPIISVTGTKGKTTVTRVLADILQKLGKNTLHVDTSGHYVNGVCKSTAAESRSVWGLVPTVCPGRFLWEFRAHPELLAGGAAILECALGCSLLSGLGYRVHKVGIFLNVYEDHLGSTKRLQTRPDIAEAKSFIFKRIAPKGYAVFNADDSYVCSQLDTISPDVTLIPCGINYAEFDIVRHLNSGGVAITVKDKQIILRRASRDEVLFDLTALPWTFEGTFKPSVYNAMHIAGGVYAYFDGQLPVNFREVVESIRLDPYGGRLTLFRTKKGVTILADYAHEKVSLRQIADLARTFTHRTGRVIGVVRLAPDRTDKLLAETGHTIAEAFDRLIIYDKIDGYWRKPASNLRTRFPQIVGRTSEVLARSVAERNPQVTRIVREDEAIRYAAEVAAPDDVVVVILNDTVERSIGFIKQYFQAEQM